MSLLEYKVKLEELCIQNAIKEINKAIKYLTEAIKYLENKKEGNYESN